MTEKITRTAMAAREGCAFMIAQMVRWVNRLQDDVPQAMRTRGMKYFRQGSVEIESGGPDRVEGLVVSGSSLNSVVVRLEGDNDVIASCDCASSQNGNVCRHAWAMLLAAEGAGYLHRIASRWDPRLVARAFEDEPDSGRPRPRKARQAPPAWKEHLEKLRLAVGAESPPAPAKRRRIFYLIDGEECASQGRLIVSLGESPLKKNGEWGKTVFRGGYVRDLHLLDFEDRRLLGLLAGSLNTSPYSYCPTFHAVPHSSIEILLPMLGATGRLHYGSRSRADDHQTLRWDDGPPWEFRLTIREDGIDGKYAMQGVLRREGEELPVSTPLLILPGIVVLPGTAARCEIGNALPWIPLLRREDRIDILAADRDDFLSELVQFPALPPADVAPEFRIETQTFVAPPTLKIRAIRDPWARQKMLACEVYFDYALPVAETNVAAALRDPSTGGFFRRDREAEGRAMERLAALGLKRNQSWNRRGWVLPASSLPAVVRALVPEGWKIEAEGKLYRNPGALRFDVTSGIDWLDLEGAADFEGQQVELPELLKALARGEDLIALGDGSYGMLPKEWLKRFGLLAAFGKTVDGRVRFTHRQASLLDALLASEPEATFDEGFRRIRDRLDSFAGVKPTPATGRFRGTLRHYQQEGLGWLQFVRNFGLGGCLADDMGLGKTVQVLALIDAAPREGPVLVVAPRSLVFNWIQEAARFTPNLKVLDWSGAARKAQKDQILLHDVVITTYGTLRRDITDLREILFDTVVLDEAQAIKNAATESAKAARLLKSTHRLALSGTPIENRLTDLWSLFEFLNPGLLGNGLIFRNRTPAPEAPADESSRILSAALRPFILRRTKEKVATELPEKTEQTIYCELDARQRRLYDELRAHYRAALLGRIETEGIEKSKMHILEALLRLRQAACHPGLIDKNHRTEPSAKLDSLLPQLQEVAEGGHKALVFSQFTSLLAILRERLDAEKLPYEYLDGKTRDRAERVSRFQEDPTCPFFLISLKAGGLGLNLTAAEYVFLLDPWWNPAVEAQAIDRTHRIGQSRRVFAYRLIARDTVEEKVIQLQQSKRALADAIITADNSVLAGLNRETLELLLS